MWAHATKVPPYKPVKRSWRLLLRKSVAHFINFSSRFYGLIPLTEWNVLNDIWLLCWLLEIIFVFWTINSTYKSVARKSQLRTIVGVIQFISKMSTHLVLLWSSKNTREQRAKIFTKLSELELCLRENSTKISLKLTFVTLGMTVTMYFITISIGIIREFGTTKIYWLILMSVFAKHFKMLDFLNAVITANEYTALLRCRIDDLGERNLERHFKAFSRRRFTSVAEKKQREELPPSEDLVGELQQVSVCKRLYTELYELFQLIGKCYGGSILICIGFYFIDFVSYSYSLVLFLVTKDGLYSSTETISFLAIIVMWLYAVCWYCQESYNESRHIGCLIYKLVKPLGNKRYNDLVSEFSLQALHQQFVITAKEFFTLNLSLLGTMVAAIITYLVILIQFMFTENTNPRKSLLAIINSTKTVDVKN